MSKNTKFWIDEPVALFSDSSVLPSRNMTQAEKLNALTRLVLLISGGLYLSGYKYWATFLIGGVLVVLLMYCTTGKKPVDDSDNEQTELEPDSETLKEGFSIVPTYVGTDFNQTIVSPTFAEEWQIPPPAYDEYTQVPYVGDQQDTFEVPLIPQSYPYGQYLTKTNLLPSDEYYTHMGCGGTQNAREYVNSSFLRHDLAFRDNMTRIYKKSLARRFRQNTQDTFSPYHSN